ncbi:MAG: hypothetical protein INR73_16285 [Williamsia sp.]|nr:hypothetical protein [Williamsia sp.]
MKAIRRYWWVLLLVIIGIFAYAYREYNRKPADLNDVQAEASVQASALVALYEKDEEKANKLYLGKAIDVSGTIAEINNQKDTSVNVLLGGKDDMHRVSCLLNPNQLDEIKKVKAGDPISLRGICTGYLMDVELNRCVIVKQ